METRRFEALFRDYDGNGTERGGHAPHLPNPPRLFDPQLQNKVFHTKHIARRYGLEKKTWKQKQFSNAPKQKQFASRKQPAAVKDAMTNATEQSDKERATILAQSKLVLHGLLAELESSPLASTMTTAKRIRALRVALSELNAPPAKVSP